MKLKGKVALVTGGGGGMGRARCLKFGSGGGGGAVAKLGRLDILVNNAGWTHRVNHRELEGLTEEVLERTWTVNVKGPLYCIRAAIPHMLKGGGGAIVNVTSLSG